MTRPQLPRACVLALLVLAATLRSGDSGTAAAPPQKRALLIGVNEYQVVRDLRGCSNDILQMRALLVGKFEFPESNISLLQDAEATRSGVENALRSLIGATGRDDTVVIHFSGHGSRVADVSDDESDGWDETLVVHDSRQPDVFDITDDELNVWLRELERKTSNVTVILDSCHSGSATRGGAEARRVPDDRRQPPAHPPLASRRGVESAGDLRSAAAGYVLVTGSRPHELSNEFEVDGHAQGALTHFLVKALASAGKGTTWRDVIEQVQDRVTQTFPSQHPDLEGPRDRLVFGLSEALPEAYFLTNPAPGGGVVITAGTLQGLSAGTELDVFPPGARAFGDAAARVARVRITAADALRARGDVLDGAVAAAASRAVVRTRLYPETNLRVVLDVGEAFGTSLREELRKYAFIQVADDLAAADIRLWENGGLLLMESADRVPLSRAFPVSDADAVGRVTKRLVSWARWFAVLRLENPGRQLPVALRVGDGRSRRFTSGDTVDVTLENRSSHNVYVILLDLDVDGAIAPLHTPADEHDFVAPGLSRTQRIGLVVPASRSIVPDVIKAIVTTVPVDPGAFTQAAPRAGVTPALSQHPLARLVESTALASRAAMAVPVEDWATAQVRIETQAADTRGALDAAPEPVPPRLAGYVLHFDEAGTRGDPRARAAEALSPCPAVPGAQPDSCWQLAPLARDLPLIEARAGGREDDTRTPLSLGAAWDEAYGMRERTGAEFVEPVFEVPADERSPVSRALGDVPHRPGAKADSEWSLKHADVPAAIARLRQLGRPAGREADGILIGHPDTGYREHLEVWDADETRSPVMWRHGWDFVDGDPAAFDPLVAGVLLHPGHGTTSGSVIVSPPGRQLGGGLSAEFVTGAAPGARLVPLRVHTSVVHINSGRLAQAIFAASERDGATTRVGRPVDVISISMGGLPSLALYRAVREAQQRGVLLVAAAGNEVGQVVWPARFGRAIAVAATHIDCGTWPASSHGSAVDISAPGESVWRAHVGTDGSNGVSMGHGTTFATATTAGVAALWLSRHRGAAIVEQLKASGSLTDTFRTLLRQTAWRPGSATTRPPSPVTCPAGATWDPASFGAGIVDADRLLAAAIPPSTRALDVEAEPTFPIISSLFPRGSSDSDVARRYRAFLAGSSDEELRLLEVELATLYALDPVAREAIDRLTAAGEPPASAYASAREVLGTRDVSNRLAAAIREAWVPR